MFLRNESLVTVIFHTLFIHSSVFPMYEVILCLTEVTALLLPADPNKGCVMKYPLKPPLLFAGEICCLHSEDSEGRRDGLACALFTGYKGYLLITRLYKLYLVTFQ